MAATTWAHDALHHEALVRLFDNADVVLLDFDGPVCDLFRRGSTAHVAEEIKDMARRHWGFLDQAVQSCHDSHGILPLLGDMADKHDAQGSLSRRPLELAHSMVTRFERGAVKRARPTPHAEALLKRLAALGKPVAIVSNNAEGPVNQYLERRKLGPYVDVVCGRDPVEPRLMKPAPDLLFRALELLRRHEPHKALMIGDQPTDLLAAKTAGTPFLGCPRDQRRAEEMERLDADCVVRSLKPVVLAVQELTSSPRLPV
ncbi:HAD family hydrolase [Streptomyces canus]|uniref:HAD family hydrolase n=1 Tax=Streptomyces canus TaxID=58343 RepID=UPI002E2C2356|nr:HAD family hydrolase [Streptomyces canus]